MKSLHKIFKLPGDLKICMNVPVSKVFDPITSNLRYHDEQVRENTVDHGRWEVHFIEFFGEV